MLTVVRTRINRLRPYESWPIRPLIPRNKKGESMPSRHVFSSTVIAMVYLYVHPLLGILFLLVSLLSALVRVLGGVHYLTDVIAGFVSESWQGCCCGWGDACGDRKARRKTVPEGDILPFLCTPCGNGIKRV